MYELKSVRTKREETGRIGTNRDEWDELRIETKQDEPGRTGRNGRTETIGTKLKELGTILEKIQE